MERSIMQDLLAWKEAVKHKPLILTGIRQCGKTYILKEFGDRYFEDVAYFYFEGNTRLASVFKFDFDVQRILDELGNIILGRSIVPGKTLVIFDEIQACPEAITALKYFHEIMPELHIACAGSLLGVALRRNNISFPVGKVERMQLYPMSFVEFLQADGLQAVWGSTGKYPLEAELPELYSYPLMKALKNYYLVGGMPEAVETWVETHNFAKVKQIQDNLLQDYANDFAKYAPLAEVPKLGWIWNSVPKQLAKENNKFMFSHVKEGKRSKDLEDSLEWLIGAGLVHKLELVNVPELPLAFNADATYFKLYVADIGLLCRLSGIEPETILEDNPLYRNYKGALTENYVLLELIKLNIKPYFWRSGNTAELDFIFEHKNKLIPLEVKAEEHTRAKSYMQFCKKYAPYMGFKVSMKNVGYNEVDGTRTVSLPLYMLWNLQRYLES